MCQLAHHASRDKRAFLKLLENSPFTRLCRCSIQLPGWYLRGIFQPVLDQQHQLPIQSVTWLAGSCMKLGTQCKAATGCCRGSGAAKFGLNRGLLQVFEAFVLLASSGLQAPHTGALTAPA